MGALDLVELALAVVGFFTILVNIEEFLNRQDVSLILQRAVWFLVFLALVAAWVSGTWTAYRIYGAVGGALFGALIIVGFACAIMLVEKLIAMGKAKHRRRFYY